MQQQEKRKSTKDLTLMALLIGLMILMVTIPNIGMITIGPVSISLAHLPAVIGTIILGWKKGFLLSLAFGVISLVRAFFPAGPTDILFQNPLISVLPRLSIGFATYGVFALFSALLGKTSAHLSKSSEKKVKTISFITSVLVTTITVILIYYALTGIGKIKSNLLSVIIAGLIGAAAGAGVYAAFLNRIKNPAKTAVTFACVAGAFANTVFTLSAFYLFVPLFHKDFFSDNFEGTNALFKFLLGLVSANGLIEAIAFGVLGTPITLALLKINREGNKKNASGN